MGYELNRLMSQYGVSSPTLAYTGAPMPVAPVKPVAPVENGIFKTDNAAYQTKLKAYETALADYNANKDAAQAAYTADRAAYDKYRADYLSRVQNTPMYAQAQFQPAPNSVEGLYRTYLGRDSDPGGAAFWQQQFGNSVSPQERNTFIQAAIPELQGRGPSTTALVNFLQTGNYNGAPLALPTYSGYKPPAPTTPAAATTYDPATGLPYGADSGSTGAGDNGGGGGFGLGGGGGGGEGGGMSNGGEGGADAGWARGGRVKRRYFDGGAAEMPNPTGLPSIVEPGMLEREPGWEQAAAAAPIVAPAEVTPPMMAAIADQGGGLGALLAKYTPQQSLYGEELRTARRTAAAETAAFNSLLERALSEQTDSAPSKAELYFRMAAAFGAPTKTGHFAESLANVGKELADDAKTRRESAKADRAAKLQLGITAQKAKMDAAKDDLSTLRTLTSEEMKDARALTTKVIEQYIKSGEPESAAGKQAKDEGLKVGTPEYQARVKEIAQTNVDARFSQIQASIAQMGVAQANLALAQGKFQFQQDQAAKLTPPEMKLKTETEDTLAGIDSALGALKQAYALNPNTFDTSWKDRGVRVLLENTKSDDPRVVATRNMENLLKSQALSKLKETFPGAISNDERKALEALQGLDAKSTKERSEIIMAAYKALQSSSARNRKRLNEINQGLYRNTNPSGSID